MQRSHNSLVFLLITAALACNAPPPAAAPELAPQPAAEAAKPPPEPAAVAPAPPRPDLGRTVAGTAAGSKDHPTLVAALQAADLVNVLGSPGGADTVFAPVNAAFDKRPKGTVEELLKPEKKADLARILKHHAGVPTMTVDDMPDGGTLAMADGTKVTFHKRDGKVIVDNATILASVRASNGMVHIVDSVILTPAPAPAAP